MEDYLNPYYDPPSPEEMRARRAERTRARKERQRRKRLRRLAVAVPLLCLAAAAAIWLPQHGRAAEDVSPPEEAIPATAPAEAAVQTPQPALDMYASDATAHLGMELDSACAVLVDAETGEILAEKNGNAVIHPASMTKILTVLTAVDCIPDLTETVTFTKEMSDYAYLRGLSIAGYAPGETVTVADLLYGTILPSGADAAMGLAVCAAGDLDAFIALMNEKAAALGLSAAAHFSNCTGAYGEDHRCTAADMALILKAAMDDPICREVLSAHTYTTSRTAEHPEGLVLSNWFLRRIEDKDTGDVTVWGAKTGYINEAGSCAASCGVADSGGRFLCVTGGAGSAWKCIYDHVYLYKNYCP